MRAAYFISLFGFGWAANSLIAWLAASHPALEPVGLTIYIVGGLLWFACFVLDDLFSPYLGLDERSYHALMIAIAISAVLGVGMICLAP